MRYVSQVQTPQRVFVAEDEDDEEQSSIDFEHEVAIEEQTIIDNVICNILH